MKADGRDVVSVPSLNHQSSGLDSAIASRDVPAEFPRLVSFVAVALGCFDLIRGVVHTVLAGSVAVDVSGINIGGPSGGDQIMLMAAFGHANFITGAALIYQGVFNRAGAVFLMCIIPLALAIAGLSVNYWAADLTFQGTFPGRFNMMVYGTVCIITAGITFIYRIRAHGRSHPRARYHQ